MRLTTTPDQLLEGFPIGPQGTTACQHCGDTLYEGDRATIFASQPADTDRWAIHRPYCTTCSPDGICHPTLGCTELLAQCRLGTRADVATQQTRLVVLEPELQDSSAPATSHPSVTEIREDPLATRLEERAPQRPTNTGHR